MQADITKPYLVAGTTIVWAKGARVAMDTWKLAQHKVPSKVPGEGWSKRFPHPAFHGLEGAEARERALAMPDPTCKRVDPPWEE